MLSVWQTLQGIAESGHARPCRQALSPWQFHTFSMIGLRLALGLPQAPHRV